MTYKLTNMEIFHPLSWLHIPILQLPDRKMVSNVGVGWKKVNVIQTDTVNNSNTPSFVLIVSFCSGHAIVSTWTDEHT